MENTRSKDEVNKKESAKLNIPSEAEEVATPKKMEDSPSPDTKLVSSKHKKDTLCLEEGKPTSSQSKLNEFQTLRRLNKLRDHTSTVFPAGIMGCREDPPSDHIVSPRRFLDSIEAKDRIGHIQNTPRKRPLSTKPYSLRNPLTGVGVNSDVIRKHSSRRKDGNPLLGEGYESKSVTPSSTRIPPGGYSKGLW